MRCQVPGARCQVPGARCQVPGARRQVPGARVLPGARLNAHGSPIHPPTPPRPSARARAPEVGPCVLEANHATPPPARNPPATKPLYSNPPPLPPTLEPLGGGSPFHPWNPWAPGRKPGAHRPRGGAASSPAPAPLPAPAGAAARGGGRGAEDPDSPAAAAVGRGGGGGRRFSEEAEGAGGWGNPRGTSGEVAGITSSSFFSLLSPSFLLRFSFVSPPFLPFVPPDDDAGDDAMNAVAKRSDSGAW